MSKYSIETLIKEDIAFETTCLTEKASINALVLEADVKKAALDNLTSAPERDIEAIKIVSKESKDARKSADIAIENLEKNIDKFRRGQLTKIGCNPDNHPATHTAVKHMIIKNVMTAEHQHWLKGYVNV
ncbi:hypothetical protein FDI40_gp039 [Agrobacterium phage Atu_ph07]|uniref:Uncharacterized protein n=1 Tax=Agrobacterium phage Atu_ph07 TaxID=2024264 RepID=A0A2L0UZ99_9CAUD|nr:hypothetical protein FDI40_gp039 [Agrobacterium phage Atu_ph07]AUZ94851.1 hypothetical protein [Agrobacterium phage Atu_ph07]